MENETETSNADTTDTQSDGNTSSNTDGQVQDSNASETTPEVKDTEVSQEAEADNVEFVKDNMGKEFVSKEAFQKRVDALTAKWKEREELLTAVKEDPEVRKKFLGELAEAKAEAAAETTTSSSETKTASPDADGLKPINDWLSQLSESPEHQSFYKGQMEALLKTMDVSLSRYIDKKFADFSGKEVAPLRQQIGQRALSDFKSSHPDFGKYEAKVNQMVKSGKDIAEAYRLAKYDDLVKELAAAKGGKSSSAVQKNREQLKNVPIGKRQSSPSSQAKGDKYSLDDAINDAMRETGYGRK